MKRNGREEKSKEEKWVREEGREGGKEMRKINEERDEENER